ncbi:hypothetical protein [Hymenobacter sp.]|jgi:hypothetical protein|uniref:hypothetical protein n=1 Tax=Hymenobacter sp. TaxID=1898978 RepID=UPI002ED8B943
MAQDSTERVLFEVKLNAEQLKQESDAVRAKQAGLTTAIAATRASQKELTAELKAGAITEAEYGVQAQQLSEKLRAQTKEQAAASKTLDNLTKVQASAAGSNDQLRAELALTTAAYNALSKEQRESSEEGRALQERTKALSLEISGTEEKVNDFRRSVGNYKGAIQPLIQELVKLQAQEKNLAVGSKELAENQQRQIGFQNAAQRAAAQSGQTYDQAQKTISNYAKSIKPAIENLVKLEEEQARIVETAGETSEAYTQIGFKLAAANKAVDEAAPATQSFGSALIEAAKGSEILGGTVGRVTGLQERYTQAQGLAKLALGGTATASNVLRIAMLAIPLVAVVAGLAAVFSFLTKTQAGADFLSKKLGALNGVFSVLSNLVTDFGDDLFAAADDPKKAFSDLVDFIGNNLLNRLKAFGVIVNGILDLDPGKIADGFIQAGTGITDATAKAKAFGNVLSVAAKEGERLAVLQRELDRATDDNIDTNKRLLNEVERLKNVRDNEFNTLGVRRKANEDAFKVEQQRESTLADLASRRIEILKGEIALAGGRGKVSREQFQELKEAENELADIREDAAGKQNELITNRYQLAKEGQDKLKELAEKAEAAELQRIKDQIALQQAVIDARLLTVATGSDEEVALLAQKLAKQRELELADKKLSTDAKKAVEVKYRSDIEQLERDHLQKLRELAAESQQTAIAAQLARAREGSQEQFLLQAQAIQAELAASIAGIDQRQSAEQRAAQEDRLRAEATKSQADLEFQQALASLETHLAQQRTLVNQQYADGQLTKAQHEAALAAIERAGQETRIVTLTDYGRSTTAEVEAQSQREVAAADKAKSDKEAIYQQEQQARLAVAATAGEAADLVIEAFGKENAAGQAALAIKKTAALAEIAINLALELSAIAKNAAANPLNIPTGGIAGVSQATILSGIAIAKAAFATAKVLAFADGGLVQGPGGDKDDLIPACLSNGEAIMTAQAVRKFGPLLSYLNVQGGGKSFGYKDPMPAATMARYAEGGIVRFDPSYMSAMSNRGQGSIDYDALAEKLAGRMADTLVPGFYAAAKALPSPTLQLSELREKQNKVAINQSRADL